MIWNLTYKSILNRKTTFLLSIISIFISIILILGINRLTHSVKTHFLNTINQTDLLVGASNGELDILLNLVFHIGDGLKEVKYSSYKQIKQQKAIKWCVPIALGDSFKGFDVVGTNQDFFKFYKYSNNKLLTFKKGHNFKGFYDVIVGENVAKKFNLHIGDKIYLSHSTSNSQHHHKHIHKNRSFIISGILNHSSTPNDNIVFIQLKTDAAMHIEWQSGHFVDMHISSEKLSHMNIQPKHISGMMIGLKSKIQILEIEDKINHFKNENLKAVIPAKALSKLYKLMYELQNILLFISSMVFIASIFTMLSSMYSTLNEREREMAILRSLGFNIKIIFSLFFIEAFFIILSAIIIGNLILSIIIYFLSDYLSISYLPNIYEIILLLILFIVALISSIFPAYKIYKSSIFNGLMVKK